MLLLLMGGIYEVRRLDGLRWHDTRVKLSGDWLRRSSNIKVITATFSEAENLLLLTR
jgi:hypothetical protein